MNNKAETMRSEYDFSKARKNPYIENAKHYNGQPLTVDRKSVV